MKLSVIIPLYNSEKYISECLDSLINQNISKDEFEIIVINDGSKDNSLQLVETYAANHSNIIIYSQENKGVAVARNVGIKKANGEYIFFVDSDDYIATNIFKILINNLVDNIDLLAFKSIQTVNTSLNRTSTNIDLLPDKKIIEGISFIAEYGFKDAIGWFIVKKEFLINFNLFYLENRMLEDISFNIDLLSQAKKVVFIPIDVYRYVSRQNSIMTRANGSHFKKIIEDYERILSELEDKACEIEQINPKAAFRLRGKRRVYHRFVFGRLMRSDMKLKEINSKINIYKERKLYPVSYYTKAFKSRIMIFVFNKKYLFYPFLTIYRFFSKRAV